MFIRLWESCLTVSLHYSEPLPERRIHTWNSSGSQTGAGRRPLWSAAGDAADWQLHHPNQLPGASQGKSWMLGKYRKLFDVLLEATECENSPVKFMEDAKMTSEKIIVRKTSHPPSLVLLSHLIHVAIVIKLFQCSF